MGNDQYGIELHQRKGDDVDSPTSSVRQHEMEKSTVTDRDALEKQTRISVRTPFQTSYFMISIANTHIQRLFSFGQIFAFSLTFMSSWEAMVRYVATPALVLNGQSIDRHSATWVSPSTMAVPKRSSGP